MRGTVLIVDDLPTCREAVSASLRLAGHRILQAATGRQALRILEEYSPDAVVMDMAMPDTSGIDLLRTIREMSPWSNLPVILFTGSGDVSDLVTDYGVEACLVKSRASIAQIREVVGRAVRKSKGETMAAPAAVHS